jgi:two-component system, OmpR family, response regulator QseB
MPKKTILVIEDDTALRSLLRDLLEGEGFAVIAVEDAADAIALLSRDIDLVLLDLVMPRAAMDGFAFLSKASERAQLVNTPVIVLSGLGDSVVQALDPATATTLRIVSVVSKPIDIGALVSMVSAALDTHDRS